MQLLHILSLSILTIATVWAFVLMRRYKEWRLTSVFTIAALILLRKGYGMLDITVDGEVVKPWSAWNGLPLSLLVLAAVVFLSRILAKHNKAEEDLQRGSLIYKGVFDAADDAILLVDQQTKIIVDVNQAACQRYEYSHAEMIGLPMGVLSAEPQKTDAAISGGVRRVPLRYHRKKDGTLFPVEITSSFFLQNNREFLVSVVRDISDRHLAEEQTRKREQRLRRLNQALGELSHGDTWKSGGLSAAFQHVTEVAAQALEVERVSIWLYDDTCTKIICQDLYEQPAERHSLGFELNSSEYPSYFEALVSGRAIAIHDAHNDPRTSEFSEKYLTPLSIASVLDAPIRKLGHSIGVVCHEKIGQGRYWLPEEEAFAGSIADFVAMMIEAEDRDKAQQSLARLAKILHTTTDLVGIADVHGYLPFLNVAARKMIGFGEDEDISRMKAKDIHPGWAWRLIQEQAISTAIRDGLWAGETAIKSRDGSEVPVSQVIIAHKNSSGNLDYLSTIMRDISEQKRAEQALRQSEERYRELYEDTPSMYFTVDADGQVLSVNRFGAEHLGYEVPDLVGKSVLDVFHQDDKAAVVSRLKECLQRPGEIVEWEFRKLHKDGRLLWVKEYVRVVCGIDGKPVVLIVCDDITERKNTEMALREREQHFRTTFEHSAVGMAHLSLDGKPLLVNEKLCEVLGYTEQELLQMNNEEITHPDDWSGTQDFVRQMLAGKIPAFSIEKRYLRKDGFAIWGQVTAALVRDSNGEPKYCVAAIIDINDRKRAEEEIRKLNVELEHRVAERTAELQAANRELEAFSYSASHDLRAPLRAISGFSEALLSEYADKFDEQGIHYLDRVRIASHKMGQLIDSLLSLSRIMRKEMSRGEVNLSEMAKQILAELGTADPSRQVETMIQPGLKANADSALIRIVLENLLGNAWKYTSKRARARIEFGVTDRDGKKMFFVCDNGVGFDMTYSGALFTPFQRLHSRKEFEGEGIGLATVQRIIQRHGGEVWAEGVVNESAVFYFTVGS